MAIKCKTCKRAIFEARYGAYVCKADIGPDASVENCPYYEKGTPQESKDNEAYYKDMDYKENEE
jgi:hypothetical protein